jgi:hypothetical protein
MKNKEEIEQLAIDYAKTQVVRGKNLPEWDDKTEQLIARYFTKGYTQCQEDMADKKYKEEDIRNAIREGRNSVHFENDGSWWEDKTVEEDFIKSLNKQD